MLSINKPIDEFEKLDKCFSQHGISFCSNKKNEDICVGEMISGQVYVILTGVVSLLREEKVLIGMLQAPAIIGLAGCIIPNSIEYSLMTVSPCAGYYLPAQRVLELIEDRHLWRDAFYWLTWQNRIMELRDYHLIGNNGYKKICATLTSMMAWGEALRLQIGVINYVQQKTQVSRSVVADILSALRKGGYIEMQNGKLLSINRLPELY